MRASRSFYLAPIACALLGGVVACTEGPVAPEMTMVTAALSNHVGCPAAKKFTGGGRVDPGADSATMNGKVTFGFNIHADADCAGLKGQLEVVHHPTQTKFHTTEIEHFASWTTEDGGECGEFSGWVRVKHNNGDWHPHQFETQFCDYGEPGNNNADGRDLWRFQIYYDQTEGHGEMPFMLLSGGNIQAH